MINLPLFSSMILDDELHVLTSLVKVLFRPKISNHVKLHEKKLPLFHKMEDSEGVFNPSQFTVLHFIIFQVIQS